MVHSSQWYERYSSLRERKQVTVSNRCASRERATELVDIDVLAHHLQLHASARCDGDGDSNRRSAEQIGALRRIDNIAARSAKNRQPKPSDKDRACNRTRESHNRSGIRTALAVINENMPLLRGSDEAFIVQDSVHSASFRRQQLADAAHLTSRIVSLTCHSDDSLKLCLHTQRAKSAIGANCESKQTSP